MHSFLLFRKSIDKKKKKKRLSRSIQNKIMSDHSSCKEIDLPQSLAIKSDVKTQFCLMKTAIIGLPPPACSVRDRFQRLDS
jgi:hypothetical protein